jgi:WD40 repeat protein
LRSLEDWSRPPLRLGAHADSIRDLAFHPSGERIAAVDETGEIRFWPTTGGAAEPLRTMQATRLVGLRYDPTGRWLAGSRVETLRRTDDPTVDVPMFHPTRPWLFFPGGGGFSVWSFAHPYPWILRGHKGWVWTVAFGPDGDWLITADGFGVRAWPLQAQDHGASRILLQKDLGYFPQVDVDPVGRRLAVAAADKTILIVPIDGGPTRELTAWGPSSKVGKIRVAFSPDGRLLAAVPISGPEEEMLVRVWELGSGEVRTLGRVEGETAYLDFADNRRLVWSGNNFFTEGRGGGERVFDVETGSVEVVAEGGSEESRTVSRSGSFIITSEFRAGEEGGGADLVWRSLETGESRRITSHGDTAFSVALDPSDRWVVTGDSQGLVRIGPVSGEEPHLLYGHQGPVGTVAVSPDGRWIATGGNDRTVRLWPVPDMSKPPFHIRPIDELLATLHSLTNIRVVEDPESSTGWKMELGPFPGWKEVPEW